MIEHNKPVSLWGAIKLIEQDETIGLPLFRVGESNNLYVCETDDSLRISGFLPVSTGSGYKAEPFPSSIPLEVYRVGDPCPIPYWLKGLLKYVKTDRDAADIRKDAHQQGGSILLDVASLIEAAQDGVMAGHTKRNKRNEFKAAFADVFEETPSLAKYWVQRYREAVAKRPELLDGDEATNGLLRKIAQEWLRRFVGKANYSQLKKLLGSSRDCIFKQEDITEYEFTHLMKRAAAKDWRYLIKTFQNDQDCLSRFPGGLYFFDLFESKRMDLYPVSQQPNLIEEFTEILKISYGSLDFKRAREISLVLFGRRDLPAILHDFVFGMIHELEGLVSRTSFRLLHWTHYEYSQSVQNANVYLLAEYSLFNLKAIENGNARVDFPIYPAMDILDNGVLSSINTLLGKSS